MTHGLGNITRALRAIGFAGSMILISANSVGAEQQVPGAVVELDSVAVRILLGVTDKEPQRWDGQVRLAAGEIVRIEPWRMRPADEIMGRSGWKATSYQLNNPAQGTPRMSPTGVVITLQKGRGAILEVSTSQGDFRIPIDQVSPGVRQYFLDDRVMIDGVAPSVQVTYGDTENDFPAAASAADGSVWIAYVAHTSRGPRDLQSFEKAPEKFQALVPAGGGDQVMLARFDGNRWTEAIPASDTGQDVWRPTLALDSEDRPHVFWSHFDGTTWKLQRNLYDLASGRSPQPHPFGANAGTPKSSNPFVGTDPAAVHDRAHKIWLAWRSVNDAQSDIWLAPTFSEGHTPPKAVQTTNSASNEWSPAVAVDWRSNLHVAYDSYRNGNYDVYLRSYTQLGAASPIPIATSSRFEVRPSVACDSEGRVWVAYEQRAADWGKDFGPLSPTQGSPLYMRGSSVQVRCVVDGKLMQPAGELMKHFPDDLKRFNSFPRITFDGRGRLWLVFRHRHEAIWGANPSHMLTGGVWLEYATCYDGEEWSPPIFLANSDNLLDVRPALAQVGTGGEARLLAIYPSDGRLRREVIGEDQQRKIFFTGGGVMVPGQSKNDLFAAVLPDLGPAKPTQLVPSDPTKSGPAGPSPDVPTTRGQGPLNADPQPTGMHPNFTEDLKRIREYRINTGGKKYQLLRGEFHRHTEWSMDGGEDGALEDMWRYAIDAAELDWIGNGDHDSGGGREYPWWIIQKTTDIYHHAPRFVGMFTYERSVPYPNGHRNCMFDRRGIRTLPRLMGDDPGGVSPDDTKMLYRYLKETGGICASHTSGTGMGTDWRDNDPVAEPIVEIYQGDRNSYEALGGPRVARKQAEAIGGWKPLGMVWNAMAMGYKLGFQSSSDHWSTHISYAVAIAEEPSRTAILDAFRKRHCYGATDNIILDVRLGDAIMGDEVKIKPGENRALTLGVRVHGTAPLARIDVIKDFSFVYAAQSNESAIQFQWTDPDPSPGLSWYYVRVVQSDGQVAWGSPIWVQVPATR